jgi:signal transduction histidine kinase
VEKRHVILIVDDTPENLQVLGYMLEQDGYEVLVAASGPEAIENATASPAPDLILLDIMMPGMDGYEVCTFLKTNESTRNIPVIFATALTGDFDEHKGLELGAVDYIRKPFKPELVRTRVRNQLELKRYRDNLEELVAQRTAELTLAKEAAEAANRAKSVFLATMSHELRTPLNSINGFTDLIHRKVYGELNPEQVEYLGYVLENGRHLLALINDILDISKIEAGKVELELSRVNIRDLLANSLHFVKERAESHNIRVLSDISAAVPQNMRADERKLKQILINILSNAVKFTPDGGEVTLTARVARPEELPDVPSCGEIPTAEAILISVTDSGIGIRQEDMQRIFEPFVQGDNTSTRKYEGTGLGLALSQKLVALHGGVIWAESGNERPGSTFFILLPINVPSPLAGEG